MKTITRLIIFLLSQFCAAQSLAAPIKPLLTLPSNLKAGDYLKDLNNVLQPYVGTWEGTANNKKYTFVITKFTKKYQAFGNYYLDELKLKFRVTNLSTGVILYDNLDAVSYEQYTIYAASPSRGMLACFFTDSAANCHNPLEFYLKNITGNPYQKKYCYFREGEWDGYLVGDNCYNTINRATIPVWLPTQDLILTKQ